MNSIAQFRFPDRFTFRPELLQVINPDLRPKSEAPTDTNQLKDELCILKDRQNQPKYAYHLLLSHWRSITDCNTLPILTHSSEKSFDLSLYYVDQSVLVPPKTNIVVSNSDNIARHAYYLEINLSHLHERFFHTILNHPAFHVFVKSNRLHSGLSTTYVNTTNNFIRVNSLAIGCTHIYADQGELEPAEQLSPQASPIRRSSSNQAAQQPDFCPEPDSTTPTKRKTVTRRRLNI